MNWIPLFIGIPLGAAFAIALCGKRIKHAGDLLAVCATFALLTLSWHAVQLGHASRAIVYAIGGKVPPIGTCMVIDGFSGVMLVVVNAVSFLVMIYAISYMDLYTEKWKFHTLFMLMLAGMNGVLVNGDLFSLYVCLEVASIAGYALVAYGIEPADLEASFKYAIMGSLASILILLGIALLYSYASSLNIADIASVVAGREKSLLIYLVSVLFLAGFGLKAALVPFHAWLPDAHSSAPTPVSAVLSGVFIKTVGVYALARVFFNMLGVSSKVLFVLVVLGIVSMIVGALLAVVQKDIKRMFAYSSISQVGYIVFAFGIGTPFAILGGLLHMCNHALFKSLLFLNAGAIEYATGERDLDKLGGLSTKLPVTGVTGLVGSMSISGIPPLGGFWSKLIIVLAAIEARYFGCAFIAVLVSIITLIYYLRFQTYTFSGALSAAFAKVKEVPFTMKLSMVMLALVCCAAGLLLIPSLRPYLESAANVLASGNRYQEIVLGALK